MTANQEELRLPFRPRARLLQLLGDQLIGTPRLAVFELVKNAYDADAEQVDVILENIDVQTHLVTIEGEIEVEVIPNPDARIVVKDNGVGMSLQTIKDIWLVPAHDHREIQRRNLNRTGRGRLPLGEKGLGRFAVHKLGDKIELVTRAANEKECVVSIDWGELIDKPFLSDAAVSVSTRNPEIFTGNSTGTEITIARLRQVEWSRGEVRRLLRQITSISSPFSDRSDAFAAFLHVPEHPEWVTGVPDIDALLARAPWHFEFCFENGHIDWTYNFRGVTGIKVEPRTKEGSKEGLLIVPDRDLDEYGSDQGLRTSRARRIVAPASITRGIGPVRGEFYVFDRDRDVLQQLGEARLVENFLDESGGVRVYRDGIRVYNYGEPGDDWLGLDLRRVNTPTRNISRNIIVGAVDLDLAKSTGLTEKTNREGFVENSEYGRLRQLVLGALSLLEIERKIDKDAIRTLTGKGRDPEIDKISRPLEELRRVARKHHLSHELDPIIYKVERDYNEMRETMLRAGLSGIGLAIVFHEIEQGLRVLHDAIQSGSPSDTVKTQAGELVRILDGFTELLRKGDRSDHKLSHLLRRARDINRVRFRNHGVRLVSPSLEDGSPDAVANFAFGLALGALNNLLDNAFYWLEFRWGENVDDPGRKAAIYMRIDPDFAEGPAVIVADNGPGFQDDPERLTRPFFSRRPQGMGIGLYYASMVMELNGGRLAFPTREEADIPDEFDGATIALVFGAAS